MDTAPDEHLAWIAARERATLGPGGLAELASTTWLDATPRTISGLPGLWSADDGRAVLSGDDADDRTRVELTPGETTEIDGTRVAAFARDGEIAIRAYEAGRAERVGIEGIDRHAFDPAMIAEATVHREPSPPTPTESVDGHASTTSYDVALTFTLAGHELTLLAHDQGETLFAAFSDSAHPDMFRMLRLPAPEDGDPALVDLNRAYLPPSRFSPHYVCVRPPAQNRWDVPVVAGERGLRLAASHDELG